MRSQFDPPSPGSGPRESAASSLSPPRPPCEQLLSVAFSPVQADARPPRSTCRDRWTLSLTTGCPSPLPPSGTPPTEVRTTRRQCPPGFLFPPFSLIHPPSTPSSYPNLVFGFYVLILMIVVSGGLPACLCLVTGHLPPSPSSYRTLGLMCIVVFHFIWWLSLILHFWSASLHINIFCAMFWCASQVHITTPSYWLRPPPLRCVGWVWWWCWWWIL